MRNELTNYRKNPRCLSDMGKLTRSMTLSKSSHMRRFVRFVGLRRM